MPNPLVIPAIMGGFQTISGLFGQERQAKHNRSLAEWQHGKNLELLKYQLDYNTPANQMKRFTDAGLNPHLVYTQGNAGNWNSSPSAPSIQPTDMSIPLPNLLSMAQQTQQIELIKSQANLNNIKADESGVKQELMQAQKQLVQANPYLREEYISSLIGKMEAQVNLIKNQSVLAQTQNQLTSVNIRGSEIRNMSMLKQIDKMNKEMELLAQKFMLNKQTYTLNDIKVIREKLGVDIDVEKWANLRSDREVKAKIIESKTFENKILEVQSRFMMGDTITGQAALDVAKFFIASLIQIVK